MVKTFAFILLTFQVFFSYGQPLYYPPITGSEWSATKPESLGWNISLLPDLQAFLDSTHTKGFIILKDGKIVIEYYFDGHDATKPRYWASAGKSLTSVLVALAESEGKINLQDSTSKYLGKGWTNCKSEDENKIKIIHHITMTTGFDDGVDFSCTDPECFKCLTMPGTRWAYHNAPYTILDKILENATGQKLNAYFKTKLGDPIGMSGLFVLLGQDNVFFSTTRNMARFGLLVVGKGKWGDKQILNNESYIKKMSESSQAINPAYGYLWWLNNKGQFMLPGSQLKFNGSIIPSAPQDLFAALGKNDQKLHIVPSQNLVVVRLGDDAYGSTNNVPTQFDEALWRKLNKIMNINTTPSNEIPFFSKEQISYYSNGTVYINNKIEPDKIEIINLAGKYAKLYTKLNAINVSDLVTGIYLLRVKDRTGKMFINRFFKN